MIMANIVINVLSVEGTTQADQQLAEQIVLSIYEHGMEYWLPMPNYLIEFDHFQTDRLKPGWWIWAKTNWGCKWDIYEDHREHYELSKLRFMTANNPPDKFVMFMRTLFPQLHFYLAYKEETQDDYEQC